MPPPGYSQTQKSLCRHSPFTLADTSWTTEIQVLFIWIRTVIDFNHLLGKLMRKSRSLLRFFFKIYTFSILCRFCMLRLFMWCISLYQGFVGQFQLHILYLNYNYVIAFIYFFFEWLRSSYQRTWQSLNMSREFYDSPFMTVPRFFFIYCVFLTFSLHFHATVLQVVGSATTTIFDHIEICGAARERTRDKPLAYFQLAYILRQVEWCSVLSIRPSWLLLFIYHSFGFVFLKLGFALRYVISVVDEHTLVSL